MSREQKAVEALIEICKKFNVSLKVKKVPFSVLSPNGTYLEGFEYMPYFEANDTVEEVREISDE